MPTIKGKTIPCLNWVKEKDPVERLLYWIGEREEVRLLKEQGNDPPWTTDPILQSYRFCNVRRMDDKVSKWLFDHWYTPYRGHKNIILACVLARFINEPATLEKIGFPETWMPGRIKDTLWDMRYKGTKVFNAAYIIPAGHVAGVGKIDTIINEVCDPVAKNPPKITGETMKDAVASMKGYYGLSNFMAGQVVADLRWATPGAWRDRYWWAPMGPGSKRGMNRLHGRMIDFPLKQMQFLEELDAMIALCQHRLPCRITQKLEAMDYQNCLCEYDKYCRALLGEGTPKQRYPGGGCDYLSSRNIRGGQDYSADAPS
jgi:hypothetical protein